LQKRNRVKQTKSLQDRPAEFASEARQEGAGTPDGPEREKLLKKIRQAETAENIKRWANSPGLQVEARTGRNSISKLGVVRGRLSSERSRQVPMKQQEPMFSIQKDAGGILRIVITRPDGSQIVMPGHSGRSDQVPSPPLASFLERDHPREH
jgi:hypothetical protein